MALKTKDELKRKDPKAKTDVAKQSRKNNLYRMQTQGRKDKLDMMRQRDQVKKQETN